MVRAKYETHLFFYDPGPICFFMILDLLTKTGSESYIVILHLRVDNNAILLFQKLTTCPQNLSHDIRDNERKGNHAISMQWHIKLYIKIWKFDILFLFLAYKHGVTPIDKKLCYSYYSKYFCIKNIIFNVWICDFSFLKEWSNIT